MTFRSADRARLGALLLALAAVTTPADRVEGQESPAQPPSATECADYRVYGRWGAASSLAEVLDSARQGEVLLVGEEHDDIVGHAVEADLFEAAAAEPGGPTGREVVLSMEMFERDVQYVVDEYLDGLISESHFLSSARPWEDYERRYRPLVEAARERGAPVVAANAPRRYVNRVTREGPGSLAALSDLARSYLPPLPYPTPSERYRAQWAALMSSAMGADDQEAAAAPDHSMPPNAIYAQALWDAAMGHAIAGALVEHLGALVIHFAGSFHVERGTGIPERIEDYRPGTHVTTVVMTKVDDIAAWSADEHADLADFVILTQRPTEAARPEGG